VYFGALFEALHWVVRQFGRLGIGGGPDEDETARETRQWERIEGVQGADSASLDRDPLR
jgi:hypothetical protein